MPRSYRTLFEVPWVSFAVVILCSCRPTHPSGNYVPPQNASQHAIRVAAETNPLGIDDAQSLEGQWTLLSSCPLDPGMASPPYDSHGPGEVATLSITAPSKTEPLYWIASKKARGLWIEMLARNNDGTLYRVEQPDSYITSNRIVVGWVGQGLEFKYALQSGSNELQLRLDSEAYNLRQIFSKTNPVPRARLR